MTSMFNANPQFVSKFIAETLIRGTTPKEQLKNGANRMHKSGNT